MTTDFNADIDHSKDKILIRYTDRRAKPFQYLEIGFDRNKLTLKAKSGSGSTENQLVLKNKSIADVKTALDLIDCPPKQHQLVLSILEVLTENA